MIRRPPRSTRTDTLFPYTTLFRSWPELCLIQVADRDHAAAIDPMAPGINLKPLLDLLVGNEDMLKVFHAGGQDVEIIFNLTGKTPHPIFDTQIGQMALGQAEQVGYSNLVEAWIGLQLDKGARFTDWSRRPLDKRSEEHTSELQSLMRTSYAVFCLKKKKQR